jgi:hypothetical protein
MRYYDIVVEYDLPFNTFNCFKAISQSQELMVKFLYCLADNDKQLYPLEFFEKEFAVCFHWINQTKVNQVFENCSEEIKEKTNTFHLSKYYSELMRLITIEDDRVREDESYDRRDYDNINTLRQLIIGDTDNNADLPHVIINLNRRYFNYQGILNYQVTCLLSPAKVAENIMGISDDLWTNENEQLRRIINYYREKTPEVYTAMLVKVINQINNI